MYASDLAYHSRQARPPVIGTGIDAASTSEPVPVTWEKGGRVPGPCSTARRPGDPMSIKPRILRLAPYESNII